MSCSKGYRRQLQGAVVALEARARLSGRRRGVTVLGVVIQCNGDRRRVTPKASAMADRAWKDLAMTEPHYFPQDTEPDPESSTDEPTAEANQEAGEDDLASGYKESGDTY